MRALIAIEKSFIIPVSYLFSHMYIHKSTLVYHFKAKQADIKSRAPFSKRFRNAVQIASQERPFWNGCQNTQNRYISDTKGSNGQYVQEGGRIWWSVNEGVHIWCHPCWKWGQLRGGGGRKIRVLSDCDGDRQFAKRLFEGNGGLFKQETPSKP